MQAKTGIEARTHLAWEDLLIIQQSLRPVHERVDVLRRGQLRCLLVPYAVFPEVFVSAAAMTGQPRARGEFDRDGARRLTWVQQT